MLNRQNWPPPEHHTCLFTRNWQTTGNDVLSVFSVNWKMFLWTLKILPPCFLTGILLPSNNTDYDPSFTTLQPHVATTMIITYTRLVRITYLPCDAEMLTLIGEVNVTCVHINRKPSIWRVLQKIRRPRDKRHGVAVISLKLYLVYPHLPSNFVQCK